MSAKKTSLEREPVCQRNPLNPRHRILVVDDDEDTRRLNTEVLANSGYKVDVAANGSIAWNTLQLNEYDLLLTDHKMPRVTGVELLKKLRAARMALSVIMVSGTMPTQELNRHPWLQIDATLHKPYTPDELLATVRQVLYATDDIAGPPAPLSGLPDQSATDHLQF